GEGPLAVGRAVRHASINLICEGSSEILRLFIGREAVDPPLQRAGALVDPDAPAGAKARGVLNLGLHFAGWYPRLWLGWGRWPRYAEFGALARHLRYADRTARRLGRMLFYTMARYGPKLEKKQSVLFRLVDVGAELCAIAATCVRAQMLVRAGGEEGRRAVELADLFCRGARRRIRARFREVFRNDDARGYRVALAVLGGQHAWPEDGIIDAPTEAGQAEGALKEAG